MDAARFGLLLRYHAGGNAARPSRRHQPGPTRQETRLPVVYDFLMDLIRELNRASILRYDEDAAQIFRDFPASIKRAGSQDCRIAATALANGFTIITSNLAHFTKIGVPCEDWSLSDEN